MGEAQVIPTRVFIPHRLNKQEVQYIGRKGNFVTGQWKLGIAPHRVTRSCCPIGHLLGSPLVLILPQRPASGSLPPDAKGDEPLTRRTDPSIFKDRPNEGCCFPSCRPHIDLRILYQEVALPKIKTGPSTSTQGNVQKLDLFALFLNFYWGKIHIIWNFSF